MRNPKFTSFDETYLLRLLRQINRDKIPPILYPLWKPFRKKMVTGGRGSAKTQTVCRIMIRQASNYKLRVLFAREILDSIKESLWSELAILIPQLGYPGWVINEKVIYNKKTSSRFVFKGLRDIKAARSMKGYSRFNRLIVDEAEAVPEESWIMAVPTFREKGSEIWAIFNRYEELDPVYMLYCMGADFKTINENGGCYKTNGNTLFIECNWRDNPWFPEVLKKEMEEMKKNDYDLYLHVYENQPIAQLEFAIIERSIVDLAAKSIFRPDGPQVIGVDVARHGQDKSKAYEARGSRVRKLTERKGMEPIVFAREVASFADNRFVTFNVDNGGLGGGGFIDTLREMGYKNVTEVNFNGTPKKQKEYSNVATEMYFNAKEKLPFLDIPNDPILIQDLTARKYGYDVKGRKKIEKKEDFRDRYKRSPDDGDAFVLCLYESGSIVKMSSDDVYRSRQIVERNRRRRRLIL